MRISSTIDIDEDIVINAINLANGESYHFDDDDKVRLATAADLHVSFE